MCGIAGTWGLRPEDEDPPLALALDRLAHRGPDGRGYWRGEAVALGHRRLAILDLSRGGQPVANEDGSVRAVANGEIYNFRELGRALRQSGHRLRTRSDSEVLVHLYEEEGPAFVRHLRGMFAFAVSDGRRLLLARDPLGIKPLYYGWRRGRLHFASEMRALAPLVDRIHALPPGHVAHVASAVQPGRPLPARPFWTPPEAGRWEAVPWRDAVAQVRATLAEAVAERLVADVPLGVLLSGGLDSTLVAAMVRRMVEGPVHSFAVGLAGSPDLEYARQAAREIGTVHHEYAYTADEVRRVLPEVVRRLESFDAALVRSAVPTWFVSRLARRYVKVVLTGEGADELFAGYESLSGLTSLALDRQLLALLRDLHWTNLQRADRMSMAHGLEARVPFLDTRLVELAFRLPWSYKRPLGGPGKRILRAAARGLVPDTVIARRKAKFSQGTGTADVLRELARETVRGRDWRARARAEGVHLSSPEEWLYYQLFRDVLPADAAQWVGRTKSVVPGEVEGADAARAGS